MINFFFYNGSSIFMSRMCGMSKCFEAYLGFPQLSNALVVVHGRCRQGNTQESVKDGVILGYGLTIEWWMNGTN